MNNKQTSRILLLLCLALWIVFILLGYYYVHKPLNLDILGKLLPVMLDLAAGMGVVALSGGVGRKLCKCSSLSSLERTAVQAALGALIVGLLWILVGVLHLYFRWLTWLIFGAGLIFLRKDILGWFKDLGDLQRLWTGAGKLEKGIAVCMGALVVFQLLYAQAPALKWDALTYHLQLPRQYLDGGGLVFVHENPYWGHPQLAEMLYTFAYSLNRAETAAITGWGFGVLFFIGLTGFACRLVESFGKRTHSIHAAWIASAAVLTGYTARYLLGWAYTDLFAALFGLSAVITFLMWVDEKADSWLRWAFLFGAVAATVKWTNGVVLIGFILCLPFLVKKMRIKPSLIIQVFAIALAVALPWLVKNWAFTGNPLYPYLIPSGEFSSERVGLANGGFAGIKAWERIFLPFAITFMGVDTAAGFNFDPGPLLLLLGVPGLIACWKEEKTRLLLIMTLPSAFVIGVLSIWMGHLVQPRLFLSMLGIFGVFAGFGWVQLQDMVLLSVRMRRIAGAAIVIVLGFCAVQDAIQFVEMNPALALISTSYQEEYLEKGLGVYQDAVEQVNALPADEKVMMLWEPRGLYMPLNSQPDLWIDRFQTDVREIGSAEKIVEKWCEKGFSRVLIYKLGEDFLANDPVLRNSYKDLRSMLIEDENIAGWYNLFKLPCKK